MLLWRRGVRVQRGGGEQDRLRSLPGGGRRPEVCLQEVGSANQKRSAVASALGLCPRPSTFTPRRPRPRDAGCFRGSASIL